MPYEVRGGVALDSSKLWSFAQAMLNLEQSTFGDLLHHFGSEVKGAKLLARTRFRWAAQEPELEPVARRKHALAFLNRATAHQTPSRIEFTAYGQACLAMARGTFELLRAHRAVLFAAVIPCNVERPPGFAAEEFLRKDHVYLLERYFYFLERQAQFGLLVMDESSKSEDRTFVSRLQRYFTRTQKGRYRAARIVPSPFFVSSDMTYPIQAADVCMYCVNWGFRLPGMTGPVRTEIAAEFSPWLEELQYTGSHSGLGGKTWTVYGIVYVPDPYAKAKHAGRTEAAG
jgi:hypothetical protein